MSKKKLNILFAASEAVPYAKTEGLADVAGALPKAIKELGQAVLEYVDIYKNILGK